MRITAVSIAAVLLACQPVVAQDFLGPIQKFVEDLVPQDVPAPASPVPPSQPSARADVPMPRPRPDMAQPISEEKAGQEDPTEAGEEAESSVGEEAPPRQESAEARVYQAACPALLRGVVVGEMLPPIADGACGERSPLLVTAVRVNGREIGLSSPVTTNCAMAGALADWVGEVDAFASAALESAVADVSTGTSFMCRNRNGADTGLVSEHGFANALDVTGFTFSDGRSISVEADWKPADAPAGRLLRQAHGAACARFTTVLGPEANAEHEDHLHLDLGCHGQTCIAQICE